MSVVEINNYLKSLPSISVPISFLEILPINEILLYCYLIRYCYGLLQQNKTIIYDNKVYYYVPVDAILNALQLTKFKQRTILEKLEKKGLLHVRYGQCRTRHIHICDLQNLHKVLEKIDSQKLLEQQFVKFLNQTDVAVDKKVLQKFLNNLEDY